MGRKGVRRVVRRVLVGDDGEVLGVAMESRVEVGGRMSMRDACLVLDAEEEAAGVTM